MRSELQMLLLIWILGSTSCGPQKAKYYYVIENQTTTAKHKTIPQLYGDFNFILCDSSFVYFHTQHHYFDCSPEYDVYKPAFLRLMPEDISRIKIQALDSFLELTMKEVSVSERSSFFITIASFSDTIYDPAFKIINSFTDKHNTFFKKTIRFVTQEENRVLTAKKCP